MARATETRHGDDIEESGRPEMLLVYTAVALPALLAGVWLARVVG